MLSADTICEGRRKHLSARGFSLIELLIVVAIILIIAALAIPNFLQARISANQASAASTVRTDGMERRISTDARGSRQRGGNAHVRRRRTGG
jgi:prepilin-type N-terminal cleavage/methylation domain-containing protein